MPAPLSCPRCQLAMNLLSTDDGALHACAACDGRFLSLALLRRRLDAKRVGAFWRLAGTAGPCQCPLCLHPMEVLGQAPGPQLDRCRRCLYLWFDGGEHDDLNLQPGSQPQRSAPAAPSRGGGGSPDNVGTLGADAVDAACHILLSLLD